MSAPRKFPKQVNYRDTEEFIEMIEWTARRDFNGSIAHCMREVMRTGLNYHLKREAERVRRISERALKQPPPPGQAPLDG